MPRTKGSKNKKVIVKTQPLSNFKSMEVKVTRTQVFETAFTKKDIEELLKSKAKSLSKHLNNQEFETETIIYDKKGNIFVTLINPIIDKDITTQIQSKISNNSNVILKNE